MSSHSQQTTHGRGHEASAHGTIARSDHSGEWERPLAEVRKNVNDVLRVLFLHRWAFFVPCALIASIVFVMSLNYPRTYRATTTFERRDDDVVSNLKLSEGTGAWKRWRATMADDLTSPTVMAEAIEKLGLANDLPRDAAGVLTSAGVKRRDGLARSLAGYIEVAVSSPTEYLDKVTLNYTGPDPAMGRQLLDEIKKSYIIKSQKRIGDFLRGQEAYFQDERDRALDELKRAKGKLLALQLENPVINPTNPGDVVTKLNDAQNNLRGLELRRRDYEVEREGQLQIMAATTNTVLAFASVGPKSKGEKSVAETLSGVAMDLLGKLGQMDEELAKLTGPRGMTQQHPAVVALIGERAHLQYSLARQMEQDRAAAAGKDSEDEVRTIQSPRARISVGQIKLDSIDRRIREVDLRIETVEADIAELTEARGLVTEYLDRGETVNREVRAAEGRLSGREATLRTLEIPLRAIDRGDLVHFAEGPPARGGGIPISPKVPSIFLLALLAGLGAGALFVVLAEVFDHVYRNTGHISRGLGIPVLETIDEIVTAADRRRLFFKRVVIAPIAIAVCLGLPAATGALAYLSIERPWTYERVMKIPKQAIERIAYQADQPVPEYQVS